MVKPNKEDKYQLIQKNLKGVFNLSFPNLVNLSLNFSNTIELESQQLRLKDGTSLPLQVGMSLTANIKLRKVSYMQLLLSNFQSKAKSLREL